MMRRELTTTALLAMLAAANAAEPAQVNFSRDVRPILSENCFACHGFDKSARKADRRLDTREGATATNDGVTAVVPGKPDASELIARINASDPDDVMPPKKSGKKLTAAQKATLRRWIAEGANYQRHWSFEPPKRAEAPRISAQSPVLSAQSKSAAGSGKLRTEDWALSTNEIGRAHV